MERRAITPIIIRAKQTSDRLLNGLHMAAMGTLRHQIVAAHTLKDVAARAMTTRDAAMAAPLLVLMAMGATPAIALLTIASDHMAIAMNVQAAMPVVSNVHTSATKIIRHPADAMTTTALPISARRGAMTTTALPAIAHPSANMTTALHLNARRVVLTTIGSLIAVRPDTSIMTVRRAMKTSSMKMGSDETAAIFKLPPRRTAPLRMVSLKENSFRAITSDSMRGASRL